MIVFARAVGMGCSFLLFLMLARHSEVDAGVFRTVLTYLVMAEFFGLLGTQRWLAIEIAPAGPRRWQLFLASVVLALSAALVIALSFVGIAMSGIYGVEISHGLLLAAAATIPAALLTHAQTCLVGIGLSRHMGWLNLGENSVRALLSMVLLMLDVDVLVIIVVFVVCRWVVALVGVFSVARMLRAGSCLPLRADIREVFAQVPRFALIMLAFLVMRNAGMLFLPALNGEREAAIFAVPFQLYDLLLLVPTILAISSTNVFARQALRGKGALRWSVLQLWSLTSFFLFPLAVLALIFGADVLRTLFSHRYDASLHAFYLLMLAAPVVALDQVLSQTLQACKRFREDAFCVVLGACVMVATTALCVRSLGATGAALALLLTLLVVVVVRLWLLHGLLPASLFSRSLRRPLTVVLVLGGLVGGSRVLLGQIVPELAVWSWLPLSLVYLAVYVKLLQRCGALGAGKLARIRRFLGSRHDVSSVAEVV